MLRHSHSLSFYYLLLENVQLTTPLQRGIITLDVASCRGQVHTYIICLYSSGIICLPVMSLVPWLRSLGCFEYAFCNTLSVLSAVLVWYLLSMFPLACERFKVVIDSKKNMLCLYPCRKHGRLQYSFNNTSIGFVYMYSLPLTIFKACLVPVQNLIIPFHNPMCSESRGRMMSTNSSTHTSK